MDASASDGASTPHPVERRSHLRWRSRSKARRPVRQGIFFSRGVAWASPVRVETASACNCSSRAAMMPCLEMATPMRSVAPSCSRAYSWARAAWGGHPDSTGARPPGSGRRKREWSKRNWSPAVRASGVDPHLGDGGWKVPSRFRERETGTGGAGCGGEENGEDGGGSAGAPRSGATVECSEPWVRAAGACGHALAPRPL